MNYKIFPPTHRSKVTLTLPLSKSLSNRALIINAFTPGTPASGEFASCDDTEVLRKGLQVTDGHVNVGASGTAMRFLTAYYAAKPGTSIVLDGSERMRMRPIAPLVDALRAIGAQIDYLADEGHAPLRISGKNLEGGVVEIDGSISSQFITALMLVAPTTSRGVEIRIKGRMVSHPYIMMTMMMMMRAGVPLNFGDRSIVVPTTTYRAVEWSPEGDWSAAAFWYEAVAIGATGSITMTNLKQGSLQGDSALAEFYSRIGVETVFLEGAKGGVVNRVGKIVNRIDLDFSSQPDVAQSFAVSCCLKDIPFVFTGLSTLPLKETDRLSALQAEMRKLGYVLEVKDNSALIWNGAKTFPDRAPRIRTYQDHRMAMAFAPAATKFPGMVIEDAEVVSKSYPSFWTDFRGAGFKLEEIR